MSRLDEPLPYYKFFVQDFRANRHVQRMDYVTRGIYRELLDEQWIEGSIPDDIEALADIVGCPVDAMAIAWRSLSGRFVEIAPGRLANRKLERQRTATDAKRARYAVSGTSGGKAKFKSQLEIKRQQHAQSLATASDGLAMPSDRHIEEKSTKPGVDSNTSQGSNKQPLVLDEAIASDGLATPSNGLAIAKVPRGTVPQTIRETVYEPVNEPVTPEPHEDSFEELVNLIAQAHPRATEVVKAGKVAHYMQTAIMGAAETEAKEGEHAKNMREALQYLLTRTILYRRCTSKWPAEEKRTIANPERFYERRTYRQHESQWERINNPGPGGGRAAATAEFFDRQGQELVAEHRRRTAPSHTAGQPPGKGPRAAAGKQSSADLRRATSPLVT